MEALISGSLRSAILMGDQEVFIVYPSGTRTPTSQDIALSFPRVADDVYRVKDCSESRAIELLNNEVRKDRALVYMGLFLDRNTDEGVRNRIVEKLNSYLNHQECLEYLRGIFFSKPLPAKLFSEPALQKHLFGHVEVFVHELVRAQPSVIELHNKIERSTQDLRESSKEKLEEYIIRSQFMYRLTTRNLNELNSSREVISSATIAEEERRTILAIFDAFAETIRSKQTNLFDDEESEVPTRKYIDHVNDVLSHVRSLFHLGELGEAKHQIDLLVDEQVKRGDAQYAAKSLCNAATMAQTAGDYRLQLELAERAYGVEPNDPVTAEHIAYAHRNLGNAEHAKQWFELAHSERGHAGYLRILRQDGEPEEALSYLDGLGDSSSPELLSERAECLRVLGRFDDAIHVYKEAAEAAYEPQPLCGLAASFAESRQYEEALATYELALTRFPDAHVAYTGKGHLLARLGKLDEAMPYLQLGLEMSADRSIAFCALANALRLNGKAMRGAAWLEEEALNFDLSPECWTEMIACYRVTGKYDEAMSAIKRSRIACGDRPEFRIQEARVLSDLGKVENALELLNDSSLFVDLDLGATIEKSRLLRRLQDLEGSRREIEKLLKFHELRTVELQIEALVAGLINIDPKKTLEDRPALRQFATGEDWDFTRACGVHMLSKEEFSVTWRLSLDGKKKTPFKRLRRRFALLLGISKSLLGSPGSVRNALRGSRDVSALMVQAIAYWKLGLKARTAAMMNQLKSLNWIPPDEILNLFRTDYDASKYDAILIPLHVRLAQQSF